MNAMPCRLEEEVAALQARCRTAEAACKRAQGELQQLRSSRGGAAVVAALPPLPSGSVAAAPASVLSPKQAKAAGSAVDSAVALVRKLREAPLPAAAQKLADKLEAVAQVWLCRYAVLQLHRRATCTCAVCVLRWSTTSE